MSKKEKEKRFNSLTFALFDWDWKKPKGFRSNVRDLLRIPGRILYGLKHGYFIQATWATDAYFIAMMREILIFYKTEATGYPDEFETFAEWEAELDKMLGYLEIMDKDYPDELGLDRADWNECYRIKNENKDLFFEKFAYYFYTLWD